MGVRRQFRKGKAVGLTTYGQWGGRRTQKRESAGSLVCGGNSNRCRHWGRRRGGARGLENQKKKKCDKKKTNRQLWGVYEKKATHLLNFQRGQQGIVAEEKNKNRASETKL